MEVKFLRRYSVTVAAGANRVLNVTGDYFNIVSCNLASFEMGFNNGPTDTFEAGFSGKVGYDGGPFSEVTINNPSGSSLTVVVWLGYGELRDNKATISGSIDVDSIAGASSNPTTADVTVGATSTDLVAAANASRAEIWITNLATNTQTMRVGDANAGAGQGIPLAPGATMVIPTKGAIYAYNPGGAGEDLAVMELEA